MSVMTPTDFASEIRGGIERIFRLYGNNPAHVVLDRIEDFVWGKIIDRDRAIRRECSDREPAYLSPPRLHLEE
jgi:hypothetical protein